jgi:hypothetical protein
LEDLRQDERAMQLFGLVNALFSSDLRTAHEDFSIRRYSVIPLSPTAGLLSWVPRCDTLHDVIRDFRDSRKILLNIEVKLMQQMAPNQLYDQLSLMQKLEVFEYALANTAGEDVAKVLWHRSETSEIWLEKRNNYTRSLAVMSMVGYILGLGDRHPSNLMLARSNGKIVHIDFGDCFEVAMHRDKFPEKVPFRLTRMLVNAMEVSGIEGSFRFTCEKVMSILRENKDSLIATLEAFVHDPLISFRLLHHTSEKARKAGKKARPTNAETNKGAREDKSVSAVATPARPDEAAPQETAVGTPSPGPTNGDAVIASPPTSPTMPKSSNSKRSLPTFTLEPVPEDRRVETCAGPAGADEDDFNTGEGTDTETSATAAAGAAAALPPPLPDLNGPVTPGSAMRRSKKLPSSGSVEAVEMAPEQVQQQNLPPPPPMAQHGTVGDYGNLDDMGGLMIDDEEDGLAGVGLAIDDDDEHSGGENLRRREEAEAAARAEAEAEERRRPPEQSYKPNLHLDMINMSQSMIASVRNGDGVNKLSASFAMSRHSSAFTPGGGSNKSGSKRGRQQHPTAAAALASPDGGAVSVGSDGDGTPAQYREDLNGNHRRVSNASASVRSVLTVSTYNDDDQAQSEGPGGTFPDDDDDDCSSVHDQDEDELTSRAVFVIRRVMDKLAGFDFVDQTALQLASDLTPTTSAPVSVGPSNVTTPRTAVPYVHNATAITLSSAYVAPPPVGNVLNNSSSGMAMTVRQPLVVKEQVDRIIRQAISNENLCQSFSGWCPFW